MKYGMMQKLFWQIFKSSFKTELSNILHENNSKTVMKEAHKEYKKIISNIDEFDRGDRFLFNVLSCAMLSAILLHLHKKPTLEEVREYYRKAMTSNFFLRKSVVSEKNYTEAGRAKLKVDAEKSQKCMNPYSWRFMVEDGATLNQYTVTFYTCGICFLMTKLGLREYIPAMCSFDYDMAKLNNTVFTRKYTLASGGEYCDCHYDHQPKHK